LQMARTVPSLISRWRGTLPGATGYRRFES
jgi:hypothetical protein